MLTAEWLANLDRILERLGWAIWPFIAVCIAIFAMYIISKLGSRHVDTLENIERNISSNTVTIQTVATELKNITIQVNRQSDKIDQHDSKEEARHRETLAAIYNINEK